MAEFKNQTVGKFDGDEKPEYVSVWFDENKITSFTFHSAMINGHRVHGISSEPRYVWAAMSAFSSSPTEAVTVDGYKVYITEIWVDGNGDVRELRIGGKYGKAVARMAKTGYQELER